MVVGNTVFDQELTALADESCRREGGGSRFSEKPKADKEGKMATLWGMSYEGIATLLDPLLLMGMAESCSA